MCNLWSRRCTYCIFLCSKLRDSRSARNSRNLLHNGFHLQPEHAADDGALLLAEVVVADRPPDAPEAHLDAAGGGAVAVGQSHRHGRRAQPRVVLVRPVRAVAPTVAQEVQRQALAAALAPVEST